MHQEDEMPVFCSSAVEKAWKKLAKTFGGRRRETGGGGEMNKSRQAEQPASV